MLSRPQVYEKLARSFVCLRLDWEQGNHFKDRFGFVLGTGDQMILDPAGNVLSPQSLDLGDKPGVLFGRHGCDTTGEVLDRVISRHAVIGGKEEFKLDWFLWSVKPTRRPGGRYPASAKAIAGFARLPIVTVQGGLPDALTDPGFLRWHVRQFIWERGPAEGPGLVTISRVREGVAGDAPRVLATIKPDELTRQQFGKALDEAWLAYMKDRPLVARGYLENQHGHWMRGMRDIMIFEDEEVRKRAREGSLLAPGRLPGEAVPY